MKTFEEAVATTCYQAGDAAAEAAAIDEIARFKSLGDEIASNGSMGRLVAMLRSGVLSERISIESALITAITNGVRLGIIMERQD